ncbi:hypothetical protein CGK76_00440 [Erysipelotrichaceae bacterium 7770_A6]|jgi:hypothetical protein|nr:hypothetical protein [Erysipelotrichaceae bacterium 7770_A6]
MKKVNVFKYTGIFIGVLIITFVVMTYVSEYIYSMIGARVNFSLSFIVIEFVKFGIIYDLTFGLLTTLICIYMFKKFVDKCKQNHSLIYYQLLELEKESWCCYVVVLVAILAGFMLKNPVFIIFASLAIVILNPIYSVILVLKKDLKNLAVSKAAS